MDTWAQYQQMKAMARENELYGGLHPEARQLNTMEPDAIPPAPPQFIRGGQQLIPANSLPAFSDYQPTPGLDPYVSHRQWLREYQRSRHVVQSSMHPELDVYKTVKLDYCSGIPNIDLLPITYKTNRIRRQEERKVLINETPNAVHINDAGLNPYRPQLVGFTPGAPPAPIGERIQAFSRQNRAYLNPHLDDGKDIQIDYQEHFERFCDQTASNNLSTSNRDLEK